MRRWVCVFVGRKCQQVRFLTLGRIWYQWKSIYFYTFSCFLLFFFFVFFFLFFFLFFVFFISCYQRNFAHVEGKSNSNVVRILNSVLFKVTRRKWYEMNLVLLMISLFTVKHGSTSSLGPWKCNLDMGSSSHWGLIIASGQEANGNNLVASFRSYIKCWYVECAY